MSKFWNIVGVGALAAFALLSLPSISPALVPAPSGTQWEDASTNIFLQSEVTRVDVTIDPADLQFLLENPEFNDYKWVTVRWRNSRIDETMDNVAFRVRGNTSRNSVRKSWKLDFKRFDDVRAFHGLEEANLNGSNNDPTVVRTMIAWDVIRRMGLPYSRTHLCALYFNGEFWSLQTHVEHIDEEFAETRFGNKDGNLWKCRYQGARADLSFVQGEDYFNYAGGEVYEETNNEKDPLRNYTDIADLIRMISQASDTTIYSSLDTQIDVDSVLRYLATNVAIGSWDDYWYGSNNYYLYRNEDSLRFQWIPYDQDNVMGIDYFGVDWSNRHFDNWGDGGFGSTPAPLVDRLFDHSEWRRQYRRYLAKAADVIADPAFRAQALAWSALVTPYMDGTIEAGGVVGSQPYWAEAMTQPTTPRDVGQGGHWLGVIPFLDRRVASLRSQLAGQSTPALPAIRINEVMSSQLSTVADEAGEFDDWIELYNAGTTTVDISGWTLTDTPAEPRKFTFPAGTTMAPGAFLLVWADNTPTQGPLHAPFALSAGGEHAALYTSTAQGGLLVDDLPLPALMTGTTYGRFADGTATVMVFERPTPRAANDDRPADGGNEPRTPPRLFINEFMASNVSFISDENGGFDDWVEIYNDEAEPVDLGGLHLSDNLTNPTKWQIPAGVTIPAKGFLIFWCDNAPAEGPTHVPFALSKGGEAIGIFDNQENSFQVIDSLTFGAQLDNRSSGRFPDGGTLLQPLDVATPGISNVPVPPSVGEGWLLR